MVYFAEELWAVLKWCSILGQLPWYNSKNRCFLPNRSYTFFVHCVLGLMYLFIIWRTVVLKHDVFMKILLGSLVMFSTMVQNVKLSIWNVDDLNRLFYEMDQLDLKLVQRYNLDPSPQKYTTVIAVIVYAISALAYFSSIFSWELEGYFLLMTCLIACFDYFFAAQLTLQLFILHGICKRSKYVRQVIQGYRNFESDFEANLALLQRNISRIADIYNELFGWNIFLHIISIFISVLHVVYILLDWHASAKVTKDLLPYFTVLFLQLMHILVMSKQGQAISNDSEAITSSCCDLMVNPSKGQNQNHVRDLLQQVSVKQARISAAGFFDVNFAMVFLLFNLLVTYVIALVQIMPN